MDLKKDSLSFFLHIADLTEMQAANNNMKGLDGRASYMALKNKL